MLTLNRSSIFSFETLCITPRPSGAVLIAVAACVAVRVALAFAVHDGRAWPFSLPAKSDAMREIRYRVHGPEAPTVLLMGTSRLIDVSAACVARELSIPREEVVNFSHLGNSFWRNLALLRRNPGLAESARAVYVDVSPFQVNNEDICSDEQFLRYATPAERLAVRNGRQRTIAMVDLAVPLWSERRTPPQWLHAASFMAMPLKLRGDVLIKDVDDVKRLLWLQVGVNSPEAMAENIASTGQITELHQTALEAFVDLFPAECSILFVHIPTYGSMGELMFGTPERREAWKALRAQLEKLAAEDRPQSISVIWPETTADLGLTEADFLGDDTHFNDAGNEALCKIIAGHIRTRVQLND